MQNFVLTRANDLANAADIWQRGDMFIAGGTDLLQLMKGNLVAPRGLVDIASAHVPVIAVQSDALHLGALSTMADVAGHAGVQRGWPVISQALLLSASPQIRNMGTMAGNLLQRTRCGYFRDTGFACNKREPGSGCPAVAGDNRQLAILGGSAHCIATHPSDLPVALMALDASIALRAPGGATRVLDIGRFYRLPGDTPNIETVLQPGEVITEIMVPATAAARRSSYVKLRDRTSFAFALVSAAVALDIEDGMIREARVALGGVAPMPWRVHGVEALLVGQPAQDANFRAAAARASDDATGAGQNDFKIELARRAVLRALQTAAKMEISA